MLLFDYPNLAPSPRRVRIFLAEKGLTLPTRVVDLGKGEQYSAEYQAINPRCTVPALQLDDGTCLWDTLAICHYLEALHPEPALMGRTPTEQAQILMWYQRIDAEGFLSVADVIRNVHPHFKGHAITGKQPTEQIPALVERGRAHTEQFYRTMDERLRTSAHVAGEAFSLADIQLLCILDFGTGWGRMPIPAECEALLAWHARISARPSAKA